MTVVLGVRCSNTDYTYAVLSGSQVEPVILAKGEVMYPKNYQRPHRLMWVLQEADELIKEHKISLLVVKRFEGMKKDASYEERVEAEGAFAIAVAQNGIKNMYKKGKNTLAKDLGLKGRAKYLETSLNTNLIPGYSDFSPKMQEAVLCAWSGLR